MTDIWETAKEFYVPVTPGGSVLMDCAGQTEWEAIDNLLEAASHMPYDGWDSPDGLGFKQRGYTIEKAVSDEKGHAHD